MQKHLFPLWVLVIACVLVVTGCGLRPTGLERLQEWKYGNCFHGKRLWFVSMNWTNLKPQSQWYGSDDSAQRGDQSGKHHSRFCLFSFNVIASIFRHVLQPSGPSEPVHTGPAGWHLISSFQFKRNPQSFVSILRWQPTKCGFNLLKTSPYSNNCLFFLQGLISLNIHGKINIFRLI